MGWLAGRSNLFSRRFQVGLIVVALGASLLPAQESSPDEDEEKEKGGLTSSTFSGLKLRSIGPALTSGRVVDFAVDPRNRARYFVAAASGGLWLTENAGTTWKPVFDRQSSYSIGTVQMDPNNPLVVWVGTGENNSQRSVSYGDGIYRSDDGGRSWKRMGLEDSEHIGRILIDPDDSRVVYVAAQGPLWSAGGDRGLYKTIDGGKTWERVLEAGEHTGVTDVDWDPRDRRVLYAATHQRRRRVWTMINGGPESALHKSTDGGETWTRLKEGLPRGDLGRIGLAVSPVNPDVVYALIEAADGQGGVYRSVDQGASWEKRNGFDAAAFYYGEIIADPVDVDRVYIPNTHTMVSDDGGATVRRLPEADKHVDSHALWIDPQDPSYYLSGCDGGVYESFDRGETWHYKSNLPITQFYNLAVDNSQPFYFVYGGTQDNFTLGGPSRTASASGIVNSDWFVVRGGDGFKVQIDPRDPDTVYAEAQYGALVRFERRSGERIGIQPFDEPGQPPLRWNWDAPMLISPHAPTRLYFAANQLFRSDDRGDSWTRISGELSRAIDPNTLPVMGKIWPPEAVAKGSGTSQYGNSTAMAESSLVEGLLYVGTDDGVLNVSENGGADWRRIEQFPGVPEMTYVSRVLASSHAPGRLYLSFDNHKSGDFKPYLLKSDDRGRSWSSIASNLPENGPVLALAEDPQSPGLLFVGTEFGLFFTVDGGAKWVQLKSGLPTIAVRDLAIQAREADLVAATFGRGFYVLDDYRALRQVSAEALEQESILFPVRTALRYVENRPLGGRGKSFQGASFYTAPNPPYGALFTYYLAEARESLKEERKSAEKKEAATSYPSLDDFRAEQEEEPPAITLTVRDREGRIIRRLSGAKGSGIHRVNWDLRYAPARLEEEGALVRPGEYSVSLSQTVRGATTQLSAPQSFVVENLPGTPLGAEEEREDFRLHLRQLEASLRAGLETAETVAERLKSIRRALRETPAPILELDDSAQSLQKAVEEVLIQLRGDPVLRRYGRPQGLSLNRRVSRLINDLESSTGAPTATHYQEFRLLQQDGPPLLDRLRRLVEEELKQLEEQLDENGVPWTAGRLPRWP